MLSELWGDTLAVLIWQACTWLRLCISSHPLSVIKSVNNDNDKNEMVPVMPNKSQLLSYIMTPLPQSCSFPFCMTKPWGGLCSIRFSISLISLSLTYLWPSPSRQYPDICSFFPFMVSFLPTNYQTDFPSSTFPADHLQQQGENIVSSWLEHGQQHATLHPTQPCR